MCWFSSMLRKIQIRLVIPQFVTLLLISPCFSEFSSYHTIPYMACNFYMDLYIQLICMLLNSHLPFVHYHSWPAFFCSIYIRDIKQLLPMNRLAIHLQHLSNTPVLLQNKTDNTLIWHGSDDLADERYFEPLQWKKFSHVCTAPVKYDPRWATTHDAAFVVAGAQLHVAKHDSKSVLHLRLLFAKVSNASVTRSIWEQGSSGFSQKSSFFSTISTSITGGSEKEKQTPMVIIDSGVFPTGPPVPVQTQKLLKFVDTSHVCKGAQDSPGHWLVTGAKLDLEKGKICLHVKFSLLHFTTS